MEKGELFRSMPVLNSMVDEDAYRLSRATGRIFTLLVACIVLSLVIIASVVFTDMPEGVRICFYVAMTILAGVLTDAGFTAITTKSSWHQKYGVYTDRFK
jgi:hypothetical protein